MVRAPAVQGGPAPRRDPGELGIALVEYCLAVPANRWGHAVYSAVELKTIQEVITLVVFVVFPWSICASRSPGTTSWALHLVAAGAFFVFQKW